MLKLEIEYTLNSSLLQLLMLAGDCSKKEASSRLQTMAHECFTKMDKEEKQILHTRLRYPGTNVYLRIDVRRMGCEDWPKRTIVKGEINAIVTINVWQNDCSFSSKQVEKYLMEKILLGVK